MDFSKLAEVYEKLETTSSGNEMREILAEFFKTVPVDDIALVSHLVLGKIAPDFESKVLGLAEKSILKAIAKASGRSDKEIREIAHKKGDAGLVAEQVFKKKIFTLVPVGKLTIHQLEDGLNKIINTTGSGSQDLKAKYLMAMYQKCSSSEAKYLTRVVLGTMRIGVGDMTVLDSLSIAFTGEKKNKEVLEHAYNICPDVSVIAETLAKKGLSGVEKIKIKVGRPIKSMLAQRVKHIKEIQEKISGELAVETKYDGERVQVHLDSKRRVQLFSRRMEEISYQYPDIIEYVLKELKPSVKEIIFEAEIIPIGKKGEHLDFQTLMQRKRKTDIEEYVKKIPVNLYCFDLLYFNGESYLKKDYPTRTKKLNSIIKGPHLKMSQRVFTKNLDKLEEYFNKVTSEGYEGIMIKSQDEKSFYRAGARDWNWIKWKKEYMADVVDTYDLVIVGAFFGKGKRSGSYGSLLCASYNDSEDVFETVTKLGTGMTDQTLADLPKILDKHKVNKKPARVNCKKEMTPDVWFEPAIVVEVLAAEITRGGMHTCDDRNGRGIALRFPRFIGIRDDKSAELATTSKELAQLYEQK